MSKKDYYEVLWVDKNAGEEEIKKAYRKLAMQFHPDRNSWDKESEKRFKEVNESYSILSDREKRKQYDIYGFEWVSQWFWWFSSNVDISDIFESFFWWGFAWNSRKKSTSRRGEDLEYIISLDLKTSIYWGKEKIKYQRYEDCRSCHWEWGKGKKSCQKCKGSGHIRYRQESFFWVIEHTWVCDECEGTGETFENICSECTWEKRVTVSHEYEVDIPAWIDDGMIIKVPSEGNSGYWTKAKGDLYIKVQVKLDEKWLVRKWENLYYTLQVDLLEAILWTEKEVLFPIIWKRKIKIPAGTQFWTKIKLAGDGVKFLNKDDKGNLMVTIDIVIPKKLTKKEKDLYEKLAWEKGLTLGKHSWLFGKMFW